MNAYPEDPSCCEAMEERLTELSLGILTGRERAEVLSHVESCSWCSTELERLSLVADSLMQLAPGAEPPLGFELRLAQKLGSQAATPRELTPHPSRPVWRTRLLAAAAVIAIGIGFGIGTLTAGGSAGNTGLAATGNLTSAVLRSQGHDVGQVMVSAGAPAWMFMSFDGGNWSGRATCTVTLASGRTETIGVFRLAGGYGAWGAPLSTAAGKVRSAQLVAADGTILASAHLRA